MQTLRTHFIAYFDILGYKAEMRKNEQLFFVKNIIGMFSFHKGMKTLYKTMMDMPEKLIKYQQGPIGYKLFSDNFILYVPETGEKKTDIFNLALLINACLNIQCHFCRTGLKVRGVISRGNLYADEYFVFGSGLVNAVVKEEQINFPIIGIDDIMEKYDEVSQLIQIRETGKRLKHLDFLEYYYKRYETDKKHEKIISMLHCHSKLIDSTPFKRKTMAKRMFLIIYHNEFCDRHGFESQKHKYSLVEKLYKVYFRLVWRI